MQLLVLLIHGGNVEKWPSAPQRQADIHTHLEK